MASDRISQNQIEAITVKLRMLAADAEKARQIFIVWTYLTHDDRHTIEMTAVQPRSHMQLQEAIRAATLEVVQTYEPENDVGKSCC